MPLATLVAAVIAVAAPVRVAVPPPVRPGIAAYPRIAVPADDAQRRINAAVLRLDARVRTAARACLTGTGTHPGDWQREVNVTMRGPEFLSYLTSDDVDCGGAHPNTALAAIVYDLRSGAPVDWTTLLPTSLTGRLGLIDGEDEVKMVTLASPRLNALYRAGYDHGGDAAEEKECRTVIADEMRSGPVPMIAWLDAKAGELAVQFDLSHAEEACAETVMIPAATLRREGASLRLLDALAAAHARRDAS
ncbi:hypothetical protein [uncultured Sphingomonas sp.]|uniref:hypothetical protein n=1 Tax=uncultured Sphingomonas sp. TaxID=158754 RepID=UPI0035CA7A2E